MAKAYSTKARMTNYVASQGFSRQQYDKDTGELLSDTVVQASGIKSLGYQVTGSMGHSGPPYKEGGPFRSDRVLLERFPIKIDEDYATATQRLVNRGEIIFEVAPNGLPVDGFPLYVAPADLVGAFNAHTFPSDDLTLLGPRAIARFSPVKPGVNLAVALGELYRDGLPKFASIGDLQRTLDDYRRIQKSAKNYLSYEFGVKPLINDILNLYKTFNTIDSRLRQLVRDNGKPIRRRGVLDYSSSSTLTQLSGGNMTMGNYLPNSFASDQWVPYPLGSDVVLHTSLYSETWYVGRMRYYLPFSPSNHWDPRLVAVATGLDPNLDTLYNLVPWTWLVDWFTNLGEVATNLSQNLEFDLVQDYGFIMRKTSTTLTYDHYVHGNTHQNNITGATYVSRPRRKPVSRVTYETKERVAASPFGFGVSIDELTARQWSILGALGLSLTNFR